MLTAAAVALTLIACDSGDGGDPRDRDAGGRGETRDSGDSGGAADRLRARDPYGARACAELARGIEDPTEAVPRAYASGEAALKSATPEIKAATVRVSGDVWAHVGQMVRACRAEGVDMPEPPTP